MKILLVSNMYPDEKHPSYGIFIKKFSDELKKNGIDCRYSIMNQHDTKIGKVVGYLLFYVSSFMKALFQEWDIIYIHYASHSSAPILVASHFKKLNIYTNVHGSDVVPENKLQEKMQKYTRNILQKSKKIIVPSEYFKKYMMKKYSLEGDNIIIYPSAGVDLNVFHELSAQKRKELKIKFGIDNGIPTFGMAGRISAGKGWDTYIEAIAKLKNEGIKANYIIVGSGIENNKLNQFIRKKNLDNEVIRLGLLPQKELCEFYNVVDYLIFPTEREGESLGLVAIEAMACGTPVIASDFAAPKYYMKDGVNGYKFAMGNSDSLATNMKKAANVLNKEQYTDMHNGAKATAEEYSNDRINSILKAIINIE